MLSKRKANLFWNLLNSRKFAIRSIIQHIPNAFNYSDDILVFGKTQVEHNRVIHAVFECLSSQGLTLNKEQCVFNKTSMEFYVKKKFSSWSTAWSKKKKVQAIKIQFLWMLVMYALFLEYRYSQKCSTINAPLREFTKQGCELKWSPECQTSFNTIKNELWSTTTMAYFHPTLHIELIVDGSPVGLVTILAQYKAKSSMHHFICQ